MLKRLRLAGGAPDVDGVVGDDVEFVDAAARAARPPLRSLRRACLKNRLADQDFRCVFCSRAAKTSAASD
eukprot:4218356-Amphidinium_carterae.1